MVSGYCMKRDSPGERRRRGGWGEGRGRGGGRGEGGDSTIKGEQDDAGQGIIPSGGCFIQSGLWCKETPVTCT
jgi:hypothetical protein